MYISASSTISHQPTFRNKGFYGSAAILKKPSSVVIPDYSAFIPAMERRRMSDVLKMAITCAIDCLSQIKDEQPDAIIVGTSMGCCAHTKSFLDKIISANGNLISPTSFVLSTHNTIAGQISLLLKNHSYNCTHTQNTLSFEQAMVDAVMCVNEGCKTVLVGAADEETKELYNGAERINIDTTKSAFGSSFFILSPDKKEASSITLLDVASIGLIDELSGPIHEFLISNELSPDDIDKVLFSASNPITESSLKSIFVNSQIIDFQNISGIYFTNSAFAMDYGIGILTQDSRQGLKNILICNNLIPENLGLILLAKQD